MEAADSTKDRLSWSHRASEPGRHLLRISFALVAPWREQIIGINEIGEASADKAVSARETPAWTIFSKG